MRLSSTTLFVVSMIGLAGCEEATESDSPCVEPVADNDHNYCQEERDREAALTQEFKEESDYQESCRTELRGYLKARLCNRNESFCTCRDRLSKSGAIAQYISCPNDFTDTKPVVKGEEVWIGGAWDDDWLSGKSTAFQNAFYAKRERDEARALQRLKKEIKPVALDERMLQALLGDDDYATLQNFYGVYVGEEGTIKVSSHHYEEGEPAYPSGGYDNHEEERQAELRLSCSLKRLGKKLLITGYQGEEARCDQFPCYPGSESAFRLTRIPATVKR